MHPSIPIPASEVHEAMRSQRARAFAPASYLRVVEALQDCRCGEEGEKTPGFCDSHGWPNCGSPDTVGEGRHLGLSADILEHRHLFEWIPKNAVVDGPTPAADRGRSPGGAEWSGSIERSEEPASGLEPRVDSLHQSPPPLISEAVSLKQNRVVIEERLDEVQLAAKLCPETLKRRDRRLQQS